MIPFTGSIVTVINVDRKSDLGKLVDYGRESNLLVKDNKHFQYRCDILKKLIRLLRIDTTVSRYATLR